MKKINLTIENRHNLKGYIFLVPWIIGFSLFLAYPLVHSLILSFSQITDFGNLTMHFVGLEHYMKAFVWDIRFIPRFMESATDAFVDTPILVIYSLFLAILLNKNIKMRGIFRAIFFLPVLLGTGMIMQQLLGLNIDEIAQRTLGMDQHMLGDTMMARSITLSHTFIAYLGPDFGDIVQNILDRVSTILWRAGIPILIFLSALQGIPISLYESARCDGGGEWEMFWSITLPMISPAILVNVVFTLVDSFTSIDNSVMTFMLDVAFGEIQLGYGSALGWIYFIFILMSIGLAFLIMRRFVFYAGEK